jgi:hypothetical protein
MGGVFKDLMGLMQVVTQTYKKTTAKRYGLLAIATVDAGVGGVKSLTPDPSPEKGEGSQV